MRTAVNNGITGTQYPSPVAKSLLWSSPLFIIKGKSGGPAEQRSCYNSVRLQILSRQPVIPSTGESRANQDH
jgi:hypothetical protein